MGNALAAALNGVAGAGDLDADAAADFDGAADAPEIHAEDAGDPIELPDGKRIFPPFMQGRPVHELACEMLDMENPSRSKFMRLIGPPGTGKSQIARAIAYEMWTRRGLDVTVREGKPFYGFVELSPGPQADEFFFRYEFVPVPGDETRLVDSLFVTAMRQGWVVMIDEVNAANHAALLTLNATLDGRLTLYLPATAETVHAAPGFAVLLAYNPQLAGSTSDIPQAWRRRFPAVIEVTSNWAALLRLGAPNALVQAAAALDARRFAENDGLTWTPQFADIEDLVAMMERSGERAGIAYFVSNLVERLDAGEIGDAEALGVTNMLDAAGYHTLKVPATSSRANLNGYMRAVTR